MRNERLFEKVNPSSKSDINIDGCNVSSDMGLGKQWAIQKLYADFIFVELVDMNNGFLTDESGLTRVIKDNSSWRKGIIRSISEYAANVSGLKIGDYVTFPDDKGLKTGKTNYIDENGELKRAKDGIFLNVARIFATLKNLNE